MNLKKLKEKFGRKNYYSKTIFQTNKYLKFLKKYTFFLRAFINYLINKIGKILSFIRKIVLFILSLNRRIKDFLISKLIWSRGKLGKPVADFVVIITTFLVFLVGGVFNSSKLINSAQADPDIFQNTPDYLPKYQSTLSIVPEERKKNETIKYTVLEGDTLFSIGQRYKISADAIRYVNNLEDADSISIGQVLDIPPISGIIHKVKSGDTLDSISKLYAVPSQAIADFNYLSDLATLTIGSELVIPDAKIPQAQVKTQFAPNLSFSQGNFDNTYRKGWLIWPSSTRIVTQGFFWYHNGIDIATSWFTAMPPIWAAAEGRVIRAGWDYTGYGINVVIDHGNGWSTLYAHLSRLNVSVGQRVRQGQQIGVMGNTGRSTGPHLHFEVRKNLVRQNPFNYVLY